MIKYYIVLSIPPLTFMLEPAASVEETICWARMQEEHRQDDLSAIQIN